MQHGMALACLVASAGIIVDTLLQQGSVEIIVTFQVGWQLM